MLYSKIVEKPTNGDEASAYYIICVIFSVLIVVAAVFVVKNDAAYSNQ